MKELHVNISHKNASDSNIGSQNYPFKTIDGAKRLIEQGTRICIHAGIYRETITPSLGGSFEHPIIYYGVDNQKVIIKGSVILNQQEYRLYNYLGFRFLSFDAKMFDKYGDNTFKQKNLEISFINRWMRWIKKPNKIKTIKLFRANIWINGNRLLQVNKVIKLISVANAFYVHNSKFVYVRLGKKINTANLNIEVAVRESLFKPQLYGLGHIHICNIVFEQVANPFPIPQVGCICTMRGHHWVIKKNIIKECNSVGIDIGDQFGIEGPKLPFGGEHLVENNKIYRCGIAGIMGKRLRNTIILDNLIDECGWHNAELTYETGGIKLHCAHNVKIKRNKIIGLIGSPAIWLDYNNDNCLIEENLIIENNSKQGSIYIEASEDPNYVMKNIIIQNSGTCILLCDSSNQVIKNNVIVCSNGLIIKTDITKNRFVKNKKAQSNNNVLSNNRVYSKKFSINIKDKVFITEDNQYIKTK